MGAYSNNFLNDRLISTHFSVLKSSASEIYNIYNRVVDSVIDQLMMVTTNYIPPARQVTVSLICCSVTFMAGYVTGYSSPVIPQLKDKLLTVDQVSWFGSLTSIAGIPGAFLCSFTMDRFGRKLCVMLSLMPFVLGWLLIIAADHYSLLYAGRFFTGVGSGMSVPAASVYLGETIGRNYRGMLAPLVSVMFMLGLTCVSALGLIIPWRWLAFVPEVISLITILLLLWIPESPRYVMQTQDTGEALQIFVWLGNSSEDCKIETKDLKTKTLRVKEQELCNVSILKYYKSLLLISGLMFFKEASGIMAMLFYAEDIFLIAGYNGDPGVPPVLMAITRLLACICTSLLADRIGRRRLIVIPGIVMAVGCFAVSLHFYLKSNTSWSCSWLLVVGVLIYIAFYSVGWGILPYVYLGEIFDPMVKSTAVMIASFVRYTVMFIITQSFNTLLTMITPSGTFLLYAAVSILGIVYAVLFVPETKGTTVEEAHNLVHAYNDK